jgi:eukaryotic-like serine/threonine-protein kinase
MSAESGRNEIYVQSFPTPGGKVQVSTGGGIQPVWSRDGRELYYRSETDLMIAPVLAGDSFSVRPPVSLFRDRYGRPQSGGHITYDVMPDGSFLFIQPRETADTSSINPVIIAVFNWFQELQAAVQAR